MSPDTEKPTPEVSKEGEDSGLQMLKRQLYAREESPTFSQREEELGDLPARHGEVFTTPPSQSTPEFTDALAAQTKRRKKIIKISLIVGAFLLVFGAAVGGTLWYRSLHQVTSGQVELTIAAPDSFASGDPIAYTVHYANHSRETWQHMQVAFTAPVGFQFLTSDVEVRRDGPNYVYDAPDLPGGGKADVRFEGKLIGEQNANLLSTATVTFVPENDPKGPRTATATFTTVIRSVPVDVSIESSNSSVPGERLLAVVHVRNTSNQVQGGLYMALDVPPGMTLSTADAQFSPDFSVDGAKWELPPLKPLEETVRNIVFSIDGTEGENRTLGVHVGIEDGTNSFVQRSLSQVVSIVGSPLTITQQYNGVNGDTVVHAGDRVTGKILFHNTTTVGIKNATVKLEVQGVGFDPTKLQLQNGAYDPTTKTITWTSATVPALGVLPANQSGEIPFEFAILPANSFPTPKDGGKNNVVTMVASIDSLDIPVPLGQERHVVSDHAMLSVLTGLTLEQDAFYDDGRLGIKSSGPIPPVVGQQTTYTLRFRLGSTLNDAGNVRLKAVLPDGVKFTGKTYVTKGTIDFNDRTGEVSWSIPLVPGLTGRTSPSEQLDIQVAITPGEDKRSQAIDLLKSVSVDATDEFLNQPVTAMLDKMPTTDTAVSGQGKVQ